MNIPTRVGTLLAIIVGAINLVLIMSTELNERAYTFFFETALNLAIGPGIYLALILDLFNPWGSYAVSPFATPTIIIANMTIYYVVGNLLGLVWVWVKRTA